MDLDRLAALASLTIREEERPGLERELTRIINYMSVLDELDIADAQPMSHVLPLENVLREDAPAPSVPRHVLLAGAPDTDGETWLVPRAVE